MWAESQKNVIAKTLNWDRQNKKKIHQYLSVIRSCSQTAVLLTEAGKGEERISKTFLVTYCYKSSYFSASLSVSFSLPGLYASHTPLEDDGGVTGLARRAADGRWSPISHAQTHTHTHTHTKVSYLICLLLLIYEHSQFL